MRRYLITLVATWGVVAGGGAAGSAFADDVVGIAFVQAPEQSSATCFSSNLSKAFNCAKKKCAKRDGVSPRDCLRQAWCYPSLWSADLFLQHREGPHWHEVLCGWSSREDLLAAARLRCEGSARANLAECTIVDSWENGKKRDVTYALKPQ